MSSTVNKQPVGSAAVCVVALIFALDLSGCASPKVLITKQMVAQTPTVALSGVDSDSAKAINTGVADINRQVKIPQADPGGMVYRLRSSHILLTASGKSASDSAIADTVDVCVKGKPASSCVAAASVTIASAATGSDYYLVKSGNENPLAHTTLTPTPSGSDSSDITSVAVQINDKTTQALSSAATGAAGGAPFGPVGMAVGGLVGGAQGVFAPAAARDGAPPPQPSGIEQLICTSDYAPATTFVYQGAPTTPALFLPVSLDASGNQLNALPPPNPKVADPDLQSQVTANQSNCWHLLPYAPDNKAVEPDHTNATGWLYRIIVLSRPDGVTTADALLTTKPTTSLLFNPCELVEVDFEWWQDAVAATKGVDKTKIVSPTKVLTEQIAVHDDVMPIRLPKSGTIKFGGACGASVQATAYTSSTGWDYLAGVANFAETIEKNESQKSSK